MTEEKENKAITAKDQGSTDQSNKAIKKKVVKKTDKKTDKNDNARSGNVLSIVITVVLIILVIGISFFLHGRLSKLEKDVQQSSSDSSSVEQNINANLDNRLKAVLSEVSSVQQKLDELESKQQVLARSLSQPVEQQIHVNEDYALAEIEHLLIIANYNLQLEHNVATALSAMESVDTRLKAFTDPAAISAREQLIADMNELRSLNQADLSGMALYLSDLINRVDELELKENVVVESELVIESKEKESNESVSSFKQFFTLVWEELKGLVVITRDNEVAAARLLPDEVYFLRANLKLELANARFAVFNRDTENLHMSIKHLQTWLQSYFDLADANVRNIYDTLSAMKKTELEFPELDISSSLESVRALSRIKEEPPALEPEEESTVESTKEEVEEVIEESNEATGITIE